MAVNIAPRWIRLVVNSVYSCLRSPFSITLVLGQCLQAPPNACIDCATWWRCTQAPLLSSVTCVCHERYFLLVVEFFGPGWCGVQHHVEKSTRQFRHHRWWALARPRSGVRHYCCWIGGAKRGRFFFHTSVASCHDHLPLCPYRKWRHGNHDSF